MMISEHCTQHQYHLLDLVALVVYLHQYLKAHLPLNLPLVGSSVFLRVPNVLSVAMVQLDHLAPSHLVAHRALDLADHHHLQKSIIIIIRLPAALADMDAVVVYLVSQYLVS